MEDYQNSQIKESIGDIDRLSREVEDDCSALPCVALRCFALMNVNLK